MHLIYFNDNYNTYCEFITEYECFTTFLQTIQNKHKSIDLPLIPTKKNQQKELHYFLMECTLKEENIALYFYKQNEKEEYYLIYMFDQFIKVKLLGQNDRAYLLLDEHKRFHIYDISEKLIELEGFYFFDKIFENH